MPVRIWRPRLLLPYLFPVLATPVRVTAAITQRATLFPTTRLLLYLLDHCIVEMLETLNTEMRSITLGGDSKLFTSKKDAAFFDAVSFRAYLPEFDIDKRHKGHILLKRKLSNLAHGDAKQEKVASRLRDRFLM